MAESDGNRRDFLGAGVVFPFGLDGDQKIMVNRLEDHVRQSIQLILHTGKNERVMRPDFGAGLLQLAFSPLTQATAALVKNQVQQALVRYEPRIEVLDVKVSLSRSAEGPIPGLPGDPGDPGELLIDVRYRVRATDTTFNLVFPFYVERGQA